MLSKRYDLPNFDFSHCPFIHIYFRQVVNTTIAMLNLVSIKGRAQMQCLLQTPITFNLLEI